MTELVVVVSIMTSNHVASKTFQCLSTIARRGTLNLEHLLVDQVIVNQLIKKCDGIESLMEWAQELSQSLHDFYYRDPDWLLMAGRVRMYMLEQWTPNTFSECSRQLGKLQDSAYANFVQDNTDRLDTLIQHDRNYNFNLFGISTLFESYLLRVRSSSSPDEPSDIRGILDIVERPQYMYMRVAVFLWYSLSNETEKWTRIQQTYQLLSTHQYTHATPTLFNAGTVMPTLTSCFTLDVQDDTESISKSWHDMALISKACGGIGICNSFIRHSEVAQRKQDTSLIDWARITQDILKAFNQGMKRKGSAAVFLNAWHIDVEKLIHLRQPHGKEDERTRDLFTALWIHDEFMRRVEKDESWTLFCPHTVPKLTRLWGEEFEKQYAEYEAQAEAGQIRYSKKIRARTLFNTIMVAQIESGTPYMLYADAVNRKSNQKNIGPIVTSNLCVSGNTLLLTNKGNLPIHTLKDSIVNVWNGNEWSSTMVRQTGVHQNLLKVRVSNSWGYEATLDCTPYHKFVMSNGQLTEARQLKSGVLLKCFDRMPDIPMTDECPWISMGDGISNTVEVVDVEEGLTNQVTYCVGEPKRHCAVFNGILTANCSEITLHTDQNNIGSCNLANVVLQECVVKKQVDYSTKDHTDAYLPQDMVNKIMEYNDELYFDFDRLHEVTRFVVRVMDRVIDMNYYNPRIPEIEFANRNNRPLGIGVQGLADVFAMLNLPWTSPQARKLNHDIFECMYHACVTESVVLAAELGPYPRFQGSPSSYGLFQFDLWSQASSNDTLTQHQSERYDWESLREEMVQYGLRHSLLMALMPTASTASIIGSTECFEPMKQCVYSRTVLSGTHIVVNRYCIKELMSLGLWTESNFKNIMASRGSIQCLSDDALGSSDISQMRMKHLKSKYLTCYELSQKLLLDMSADRGQYICQSQSFNCFMAQPTLAKLSAYHFHAWKLGLKTGMYYLKQLSESDAKNFADTAWVMNESKSQSTPKMVCDDEVCTSCQ